jgi:hypothetical protein
MAWPVEHLGANAILHPGFSIKDHTRAAIQRLSGEVPQRTVFSHTGWRELGGRWMYLHAGGAIGPEGAVAGVETSLLGDLARFVLPDPLSADELVHAVRASLGFLEVAPAAIAVPLYAALWRAPLGLADFSLHLTGKTGIGKSELAALAQQHYGAGLDARHLPGSWSSTGNALESLAFAVKDAVFVVDDFAPAGSSSAVARLHGDADRVFRAQGNRSGRQRMRADGTLRATKPPRGLIISTGEDVPQGQSLRARFLTLALSEGDVDWSRLTSRQRDARAGLSARALAGYVCWLAQRYPMIRDRLRDEVEELREQAGTGRKHRRTPHIMAELGVGFRYFLSFAQDIGALGRSEAEELEKRCWDALGEAAAAQGSTLMATDPVPRFFEFLAAAITSGRAHVAALDGDAPQRPGSWGWRAEDRSDSAQTAWHPKGDRIGWLDGDDLYLEPEAAHAAAQRLARDAGETIPLRPETLRHRLKDAGLLRSFEERRRRLTARKVIEGTRRNVLHLSADALDGPSSDEPSQPAHPSHQGNGDMTHQAGPGSDGARESPPEPTRVGTREVFTV